MTTYDERRARHLHTYDHTHTPNGAFLALATAQSAGNDPKCADCKRTIITRAHTGTPEPWQHAIECPNYEPHPNSIAGQPGYQPGPGRLGYNEPA
ncbi:hypothetical protein GCM10027591_03770 [Zhihengliuella somnathii]